MRIRGGSSVLVWTARASPPAASAASATTILPVRAPRVLAVAPLPVLMMSCAKSSGTRACRLFYRHRIPRLGPFLRWIRSTLPVVPRGSWPLQHPFPYLEHPSLCAARAWAQRILPGTRISLRARRRQTHLLHMSSPCKLSRMSGVLFCTFHDIIYPNHLVAVVYFLAFYSHRVSPSHPPISSSPHCHHQL